MTETKRWIDLIVTTQQENPLVTKVEEQTSLMSWSHFLRCLSRWVGDLICIHRPAAHQPHCGGPGKFGHRREALQVLTTPLKFFGHRQCLICKWGTANMSLNHREVAANVGGCHCSGRPAAVRCSRGGSTAMFILSGGGCSVTSLLSPDVGGRRNAIMGWHLCQWSVRISKI